MIADSRITLELLNTDGKLGILPLALAGGRKCRGRDFARAEQLSNQVLTNAQASFGDRMLHLSILHAAGRTNFQSFLKETQQKALQHPVYIGELAAWLNQFGFASEALTWLQRCLAKSQPGIDPAGAGGFLRGAQEMEGVGDLWKRNIGLARIISGLPC